MKRLTLPIMLILLLTSALFASWKTGHFVDEFGDNTGETYRGTEVVGVMRNTATNGAAASLEVIFKSTGKAYISINEYGRSPVTGYTRGTPFKFSMKGNITGNVSFTWTWYNNSAIFFGPSYTTKLKNAFKKNTSVIMVITNLDRPTSIYKFVIPCSDY